MTVYYSDIRALIDPEHADPLKGGGCLQDVSVILTDRFGGPGSERPAAVTLLPYKARELALCLLQLADEADDMRRRP